MTYQVYRIAYRQYGKQYKVYKIPMSNTLYTQFIKNCNKYNVNPYEFLDYWLSQKFYLPAQLSKAWYFKEYKKKFHQEAADDLFYLILQYKWLDGETIDRDLPLIEYRKLHSLEDTAKLYSTIFVVTHSNIEGMLDNTEFSEKIKSILPVSFNVAEHDINSVYERLEKLVKKQSLPLLTEKQKLLLYGGASI